MTMLGFLTITGSSQGSIQGSSIHHEHEGEIEILSLEHQVEVPGGLDATLSAGRPLHGALVINKEIDKSTPKLAQALCTREVLSEVNIAWYRHSSNGTRELYYRIELKNALISKVKAWTPHLYEQEQDQYRLMEDVAFSYEKILWSWGAEAEVEYEIQAKGTESS